MSTTRTSAMPGSVTSTGTPTPQPPGVNAFVAALASTRLVADTSVSTEKGPVAEGWSSRHAVTRRQSPGSARHGQAKDAPRATRDAICDATGSEPTPRPCPHARPQEGQHEALWHVPYASMPASPPSRDSGTSISGLPPFPYNRAAQEWLGIVLWKYRPEHDPSIWTVYYSPELEGAAGSSLAALKSSKPSLTHGIVTPSSSDIVGIELPLLFLRLGPERRMAVLKPEVVIQVAAMVQALKQLVDCPFRLLR